MNIIFLSESKSTADQVFFGFQGDIDISKCDRSTLDSDYIPTDSSMDGFDEYDDDNWMLADEEREVKIARAMGSVRSGGRGVMSDVAADIFIYKNIESR